MIATEVRGKAGRLLLDCLLWFHASTIFCTTERPGLERSACRSTRRLTESQGRPEEVCSKMSYFCAPIPTDYVSNKWMIIYLKVAVHPL